MASTHVQLEVEDWVRREWLLDHYGVRFSRERVSLSPGGVFDFDAVSDDGEIVATISTSSSHTSSGKLGVGKMMKIRSDAFFLLLAGAATKALVFTEEDMFEQWMAERTKGRIPSSIELLWARIPKELNDKLAAARGIASKEVRPR